MKHWEIRYRILFFLYLKHFIDQLGQTQITNRLIQEAGLEYVEKNQVYGDIVYLKEGDLVKGTETIGQPVPYTLKITNRGIDVVEKMINDFIKFLENHKNEDLQSEARTLKLIGSPTARLQALKGLLVHKGELFSEFIDQVESEIFKQRTI